MESRFFDNANQCIEAPVAIHITRTEPIDGVGQSPIVQPVETIAYLAELVGFASSALISVSTSSICNERL